MTCSSLLSSSHVQTGAIRSARTRVLTALPERSARSSSETLRSRHRSGSRPTLYLQHAPRLGRFNHLADNQAPGTTPVARVLPRLVDLVEVWVTSLARFHLAARVRVASPPGFASLSPEPSPGFQAVECRSSALPIRTGAFAVRHRLPHFSPASPCGPFTVELFTAEGLPFGPRGCHPRSVYLAAAELPALARVERTSSASKTPEARTPRADLAARRRSCLRG